MSEHKLPHGCQHCGARWGGLNTGHCKARGCHETFSGVTAFDRHRVGGVCKHPADVGLVESSRAYPCWSFPAAEGGEPWWDPFGSKS